MILAGIDEAGYGPTLGPLVVSVSAFRVADAPPRADGRREGPPDLWALLGDAVCRAPDGHRVPVDDSKRLFHQKKGLRDLEEGIYPFLGLRDGEVPRDFLSLLRRVTRREGAGARGEPGPEAYLEDYPWYRARNLELPVHTWANYVISRSREVRASMERAGVEFLGLAARPVEVLELNAGIEATGNKARVSFEAVGSFLRRLWTRFPRESVEVFVDRQGGRVSYAPLLYEKVRPRGILIEEQTAETSTYALTRAGSRTPRVPGRAGQHDTAARPFRVTFGVESESRSFPVALASMLSKYVRELHMILFNSWWRERRADLKPTAGYAVDARRFLDDTAILRQELGLPDGILIRRR